MKKVMKSLILAAALLALVLAGCGKPADPSFSAAPASSRGASSQVSSFGSNPGSLTMYKYVPTNPKPNAALVVALHGCTQNASDYATQTGWNTLAEKYGFYVVYAEQSSANNSSKCFNWFESGDIARGQGEALSIANMVAKMKADYTIDASKVFVTGLSAGGYMTAVMMATYPDVFAGGAVMAGGPYKCATSMTAAFNCMSPGVDKSTSDWKTLAKSGYSGYTGSYPTLMVFQGSTDATVKSLNMTELVDQWTAIHNIDQTADEAQSIAGHEVKLYKDAAQKTLVKTYLISSMGHAITVDPGTGEEQGGATGSYSVDKNLYSSYHAADFWGLTNKDQEKPVVTITAPANGQTLTGTVAVSATATDNEGVAKVEFFLGGVLKGTDTSAPYSFSWNTANEYNGNYTLTVKATDVNGLTDEKSIAVTITGGLTDTTAPTVTADKDSGTYTTSVTVALSANEPATLYYTTNGSTPTTSSAVYSAPLTFTADTTLKFIGKDGSGNISAVVTKNYTIDIMPYSETANGTCTEHYMANRLDVTGYTSCGSKYGYSAKMDMYKLKTTGAWVFEDQLPGFEADTTAPVVSLTAPANGATVSGTLNLVAAASDNKAVTKVEFYAAGALKSTDTAAPYEYAFNTGSVANGSLVLTAKAYDAAGNVSESSVTVTVNNETSGGGDLAVAISSPASGASIKKGTTINVTGTSAGAVKVTVKLVGANSGSLYQTKTLTSALANWSTALPTGNVYFSGSYKITVEAESSTGAKTTQEIPITITLY